MTFATFPVLPGQGITVHKKPKWATIVAPHVSGRESRAQHYKWPLWDFELTFDGLDMTTTGYYGGIGAQTMQALAGFFNQVQGPAQPFLYVDPSDNRVNAGYVATADGVTTNFAITRTMGAFVEPVSALTSLTGVYLNGAPAIGGWTTAQPNVLTFGSPPPSGTVITANFTFGFVCRFSEDVQDFEEFLTQLSAVKTMTFQSVREVLPINITAWRTIIISDPNVTEFCAPSDWNNNFNQVNAIGGGGSGGYGAGAIGGGGGAFTYRNNVQLAPGQCVPIAIGAGGPAATGGGKNSIAGYPTTFRTPGDADYIYADYGGSGASPPGGSDILNSGGGRANQCIPSDVAHSGGSGMTWGFSSRGGNGGGGAGGPFGNGGNGGSCSTNNTQSGAGGGGADGGATALDPPAADYEVGLITPGWGVPTQGGKARSTVVVGQFGKTKTPADLPANGIIPANWDAPGVPPTQLTVQIGQALFYANENRPDEQIWVFTGTGWIAPGQGGAIDTHPVAGVNGPGGPGVNGSGGGGGGGGVGGVNGSDNKPMYGYGDGGKGSTEPLWFSDGVWYGPGSGGGGAGGANSLFGGGFGGAGGDGGLFGGGGGAGGGSSHNQGGSIDGNGGRYSGAGGVGALIIIYLGVESSP